MAKRTRSVLSDEEKAVKSAARATERRERFERIAQKRVQKALVALRNVGMTGNRQVYAYTADEVSKIDSALTAALKAALDEFSSTSKGTPTFTL